MTPDEYIAGLPEPRRDHVRRLHELIRAAVPDLDPSVESGMIGYGRYRYRYESGREGEAPIIALASRARYVALYVDAVEDGQYLPERNKARLGKADVGKSCIRIANPDDVDLDALSDVVSEGARLRS